MTQSHPASSTPTLDAFLIRHADGNTNFTLRAVIPLLPNLQCVSTRSARAGSRAPSWSIPSAAFYYLCMWPSIRSCTECGEGYTNRSSPAFELPFTGRLRAILVCVLIAPDLSICHHAAPDHPCLHEHVLIEAALALRHSHPIRLSRSTPVLLWHRSMSGQRSTPRGCSSETPRGPASEFPCTRTNPHTVSQSWDPCIVLAVP